MLIALLSVLSAWGVHRELELTHFIVPWWLDAPSTLTFFWLFYGIFDRWVWRTRIARWLGIASVPSFRGRWEGYVISSFDQHGSRKSVSAEIAQTWTRMQVTTRTEDSVSYSLGATILTESPAAVLSYEYLNDPKPDAKATMHAHRGTARLTYTKAENAEILDGEYYTGRDRQNFGILHLERDVKGRNQSGCP